MAAVPSPPPSYTLRLAEPSDFDAYMDAFEAVAATQEAHKVSLGVWPTNHPAIGLYARHGFRIEGTRPRHYPRRGGALWDAVVMGLILDHDTAGGLLGERNR
jgi:RimJ/RimL family protein N-acetyltransferase